MSTHPESPTSQSRLRAAGRTLVAGVSAVNRATHRTLSWLMVVVAVAYFAFAGAFLALRYLVLPNIDHYQAEVAQVAGRMLNRPVSIGAIAASWNGLNPRLRLDEVVIHDDRGERALVLPQVNATLSWWSVLGQLRLYSLEVLRPDLEIERDTAGQLFVAGMRIDTSAADDGRGLDWLLAQREIVIRDGAVRWHDRLRDAPELALTDISFVLRNQWRSHRAALRATPPAALAAPLDLRADFTRSPFSQRSSDYRQWSGEFYMDWRNTRLDRWKPYIDLPWELAGGDGALRAWLSFNRGVVRDFTADLDLRNLSARLGEGLEPLQLLEASGRISAGESAPDLKQRLLSFGEQGHFLTLSDFSLRTEQGAVLPRTTASHRYVAGRQGKPERHQVQITALDLGALARLTTHLPLSADERRVLEQFAPAGELHDFSAAWDGEVPGSGEFRLAGEFRRLSIRQQLPDAAAGRTAIPGFDGLSGRIEANQDGGRIRVDGKHATVYLADYLNRPTLFFDELALDGSWSFRDARRQLAIRVDDLRFLQSGLRGSATGSHRLPWPYDPAQPGVIDIDAQFPSVALTRIVDFLPPAVGSDTDDWLRRGIQDGQAEDVRLSVRGPVEQFPFAGLPPAGGARGEFKISARVANAKINPAPTVLAADRRTPLWPRIDNINGRILLDAGRLQIHADSAKTLGVPLANVDVVIPDYLADHPVLEVAGSASGSLQGLIGYANATPVAGWTGGFTENLRAGGSARLGLKLQIPLTAADQTTVQGSLRFAGNEVQPWRSLPPVQQLGGELQFSERGFRLVNLGGDLLGAPVALSGGTQRDGSTQVRLDGVLTPEVLARLAPDPRADRLLQRVTGSTRYTAVVKLRNQRPEIVFDSSLAGLAIGLPAPLDKAAADSLPLHVSLAPLADAGGRAEELRVTLGRLLAARYQLQQPADGAEWKLVRGGIGINGPASLPESGLAVSAIVPALDVDAWRDVLSAPSAAAQQTMDADAPGLAASFVRPDSVRLRSTALTFAGRAIENLRLNASRSGNGWQFAIDADEIVGRASWEDPLSERGAGKLSARLSLLKVEQSTASEVTDLLSGRKSVTELPGLDVVADSFELRGLKLGRLELAATNAGLARGPGREWRISKLTIGNPDATMRATGRWLTSLTDSQTTLNYELEIADAGQLLDRFGFERTVKGGKGRMDGELSWRGDPTAFDFPSMSGNLTLKLASGRFLRADPGVAKLLGVMSLQALPRRLTLDFRDIFSEGFAFDAVSGTATIARGTLKTDTFKMSGPNGVVLMDGTVELADETQNLNVVVMPELNTSGASVVYGLAVNPVIGLGSFLAQYFLGNPLSKVLAQEYQVTGPWRDPVVKKLSSRRRAAVEQENKVP